MVLTDINWVVTRMKLIQCIISIFLLSLSLSSYADTIDYYGVDLHATTPITSPENIQILSRAPKNKHYAILGDVQVEHYNVFGIKRQRATIHNILQYKASDMGGDAIINIHHDKKGMIVATVIKFDDATA